MTQQLAAVSQAWFELEKPHFEATLAQKLEAMEGVCTELHAAMCHGLLGGGKRLRALLVIAAGKAVGTDAHLLMDTACAVEALHAYSLVHDDLPCMDNDTLRRGKPTCHVEFGETVALLAGDALQATAFQWLLQSRQLPDAVRLAQASVLSQAVGAQGMVSGQAIDWLHVGKGMDWPELKRMHGLKTGQLIVACVSLGCLSNPDSSASVRVGLAQYAESLGLAYQILDDILDVESSSVELGKTSGKDALANKPTSVSCLGLEQAKILLADLKTRALEACRVIDPVARRDLEALVELMTDRRS